MTLFLGLFKEMCPLFPIGLEPGETRVIIAFLTEKEVK
jgi:hypothetical protein